MAERRKCDAYPELSMGVVLGTKVGGWWNQGALRLVCDVVWVSARVVAKVVVPFSRLSTAHRRRHSIGQYVVGACWRQPKKTRPRARQGPQPGRVVSILDVGYVACCPV